MRASRPIRNGAAAKLRLHAITIALGFRVCDSMNDYK